MPESTVIAEAAAAVASANEKALYGEAKAAHSVDLWAARCIVLGSGLREWQKKAWNDLFSDERIDVEETRKNLKETYSMTLDYFQVTASRIEEYQRRGYAINGAEEFHRLHEEIRRLATDFDSRWPRFDPVASQQAIDRIAQGQYITPEEFR